MDEVNSPRPSLTHALGSRKRLIAPITAAAVLALVAASLAFDSGSSMPSARVESFIVRGLAHQPEAQPGALTCMGSNCVTIAGWVSPYDQEGIAVDHNWLMRVDYKAHPALATPLNGSKLPNVNILGVACPTTSECIVAAQSNIPPGNPQEWPELGVVTPTTMSFARRPHAPYLSQPWGVSCGSADWCVVPIQADGNTLVETFNGVMWSPLVAVPGVAQLDASSCPSSTRCLILGTGRDGEALVTATPTGISTQWLQIQHGGIIPSAIVCPKPVTCVIVGLNQDPGAGANGIPDEGRIDVQRVSLGKLQVASDLTSTIFSPSVGALSCATPDRCVAGGSDTGYEGVTRAMLLTEVSGRWSVDRSSFSSLDSNGYAAVTGTACTNNGNCVIDGSYAFAGPGLLSTEGTTGPTRGFIALDTQEGVENLENLGNKAQSQPGGIVCPLQSALLCNDDSGVGPDRSQGLIASFASDGYISEGIDGAHTGR